jgi:hypothetical protein
MAWPRRFKRVVYKAMPTERGAEMLYVPQWWLLWWHCYWTNYGTGFEPVAYDNKYDAFDYIRGHR